MIFGPKDPGTWQQFWMSHKHLPIQEATNQYMQQLAIFESYQLSQINTSNQITSTSAPNVIEATKIRFNRDYITPSGFYKTYDDRFKTIFGGKYVLSSNKANTGLLFNLLPDSTKYPKLAFSIFALEESVANGTNPIMRIRRDSDDTEKDIYIKSGEKHISENSPVEGGGSLGSFLDGANGYMSIWYNQNPNVSNNATQSAADTTQPKIWDATTGLITNSKNIPGFRQGIVSLETSEVYNVDNYALTATWGEANNGWYSRMPIITNVVRPWGIRWLQTWNSDGNSQYFYSGIKQDTSDGYNLFSRYHSSKKKEEIFGYQGWEIVRGLIPSDINSLHNYSGLSFVPTTNYGSFWQAVGANEISGFYIFKNGDPNFHTIPQSSSILGAEGFTISTNFTSNDGLNTIPTSTSNKIHPIRLFTYSKPTGDLIISGSTYSYTKLSVGAPSNPYTKEELDMWVVTINLKSTSYPDGTPISGSDYFLDTGMSNPEEYNKGYLYKSNVPLEIMLQGGYNGAGVNWKVFYNHYDHLNEYEGSQIYEYKSHYSEKERLDTDIQISPIGHLIYGIKNSFLTTTGINTDSYMRIPSYDGYVLKGPNRFMNQNDIDTGIFDVTRDAPVYIGANAPWKYSALYQDPSGSLWTGFETGSSFLTFTSFDFRASYGGTPKAHEVIVWDQDMTDYRTQIDSNIYHRHKMQ